MSGVASHKTCSDQRTSDIVHALREVARVADSAERTGGEVCMLDELLIIARMELTRAENILVVAANEAGGLQMLDLDYRDELEKQRRAVAFVIYRE